MAIAPTVPSPPADVAPVSDAALDRLFGVPLEDFTVFDHRARHPDWMRRAEPVVHRVAAVWERARRKAQFAWRRRKAGMSSRSSSGWLAGRRSAGNCGSSGRNAARRMLEHSGDPPPTGHVCTLRAEVEGTVFAPALRELLAGWRALGYEIFSLQDYAAGLDLARLPRHVVERKTMPGARRPVSAQGKEFLA